MTVRFQDFPMLGPRPNAPGKWSWDELMEIALAEAAGAYAADEVPVGALVVDPRGVILQKAANQTEHLNDPTAHAEILAIRGACSALGNNRLEDCVLVSTLEPCAMCAGAILEARLSAVVFGACDSHAGAVSSVIEFFSIFRAASKFWHMGGPLSADCAAILKKFFSSKRL